MKPNLSTLFLLVLSALSLTAHPQQSTSDAQRKERDAASRLAGYRLDLLPLQRRASDLQREIVRLFSAGPPVSDIDVEFEAKRVQLASLQEEKERVLLELLTGFFCSRCHRSATEIEKQEQKPFATHLADVSGVRESAPPELIEAKSREYDEKIFAAENEIRSLVERRARAEARFRQDMAEKEHDLEDARRRMAELEARASLAYREQRDARAQLDFELMLARLADPGASGPRTCPGQPSCGAGELDPTLRAAAAHDRSSSSPPSSWLADTDGSGTIDHDEGVAFVRMLGGAFVESRPGMTRFQGLSPESIDFIAAAAEASRTLGLPFVVTGAADPSGHVQGSRHYTFDAIDFRARERDTAERLQEEIRTELARRGYEIGNAKGQVKVEIHGPPSYTQRHVHVQFNR